MLQPWSLITTPLRNMKKLLICVFFVSSAFFFHINNLSSDLRKLILIQRHSKSVAALICVNIQRYPPKMDLVAMPRIISNTFFFVP